MTRHAGSEPLRILELGSGMGMTAAAVQPFTDERYDEPCELGDAMLYLATLEPA